MLSCDLRIGLNGGLRWSPLTSTSKKKSKKSIERQSSEHSVHDKLLVNNTQLIIIEMRKLKDPFLRFESKSSVQAGMEGIGGWATTLHAFMPDAQWSIIPTLDLRSLTC